MHAASASTRHCPWDWPFHWVLHPSTLKHPSGLLPLTLRAVRAPLALELTTQPTAFPPPDSLVNAETAELLRQATGAWSHTSHRVWPLSFRRGAVVVMLVGQRPHALEPEGRGRTPDDVWMLILSFCGRGWFLVDEE